MNDEAIEKLWDLAPPETPEAPETPPAPDRLRAFNEALARDAHAAKAWQAEAEWLASLNPATHPGTLPGSLPGVLPGEMDATRFVQRVIDRLGAASTARASSRGKWNAAIFSALWAAVAVGVALAIRHNQGPPPRKPGAEVGQEIISVAVQGLSDQAGRTRENLADFLRTAQAWLDIASPAPPAAAAVPAVAAAPAPGHAAARLAPAATGLYIEVENLSAWEDTLDTDPVVHAFWRLMPDYRNMLGQWQSIQFNLGLTEDQFINRYFGKSFAMISPDPGPGSPLLLLSRVGQADADNLVKQLGFVVEGPAGHFKVYATRDGAVEVALGGGWLVLGLSESGKYMDAVLSQPDSAARLADDATFKQWIGKLGADPEALLYAAPKESGQVHAAAMFRRQDARHFEYVGESPEFAALRSLLGKSDGADFGPLPRAAAGAAAVNIQALAPAQAAAIDRLLGPGVFEADLQPKLRGPVVLFVGPAPSRDTMGQGPLFPPAGLMVRMRDPAVAPDLDRIITQLVLAANLASGQNHPPIGLRQAAYAGENYSVAQIGDALAAKFDWPQLVPTQLVYGKAGDWYIVCTQEQFFQSILDAPKATGLAPPAPRPADAGWLVLTAEAQGEAISQIMALWVMRWREGHPHTPLFIPSQDMSPEMFRVRQTAILTRMLGHYKAMSFRFQSVAPDELRADLDLQNGDMTLDTRY